MGALSQWTEGSDVVWWSDRAGRCLRLAPETLARLEASPDAPALAPLRRRLADLGLAGEPRWDAWVPCRSRCVLLLPDEPALWVPMPAVHTAGGRGYRAVPLTLEGLAVWRAINDSRPVAAIAKRTNLEHDTVHTILRGWTSPDVQAAQLRLRPPRPGDPSLERVVGVSRPDAPRTADQHDARGATTLAAYHLDAITDGATHFDDRETTLAHALAPPHPILGHQPYGARLRSRLASRGLPTAGPVVEVGCGDGELARDWGEAPLYLRIDLSPELLQTQRATAPATSGVLADATRLPLRDASVSLLLCNEVMADLTSVPTASGWDNVGATKLLEEVGRVLAPGGWAVLTEFGVLDGEVAEATQLDHPEVAIQFSRLVHVAEALGLDVACTGLPELLGFEPDTRWLSRPSWMALRALARSAGHHLQARAWTPASLERDLPFAVENLAWVPWTQPGPGPLPTRFYALVVNRPV